MRQPTAFVSNLWHKFHGNDRPSKRQLSDAEIDFLRRLQGKPTNDASVLGWFCAFNKLDGPATLDRLCADDYLTVADYRYSVQRATVPKLKEFLKTHGLSTRGNKHNLVNRIVDNISEAECAKHFTRRYWAFTSKTVELFKAEESKAQEEYKKDIDLIRGGLYDDLKKRLYPNRNEHWGTEDTFRDTIDYVMRHGFEGCEFTEDTRRKLSSFVALRSVDYSSRGHAACMGDIADCLESSACETNSFMLPISLNEYAKENGIVGQEDILDLYIRFIIDRARAVAELKNYGRLGMKKIRIDALACGTCGRLESDAIYNIKDAPLLPLNWNCRCCYILVP
jgi:hypothetical protein